MSVRLASAICLSTVVGVMGAASPRAQETTALDLYRIHARADAAREAGDERDALAGYLLVADQQPDNAELWTHVFRIASSLGDTGTVVRAGDRLDAIGHRLGARLAYTMARTHALRGETGLALEWLAQALRDRYDNRPGIWEDDGFADLRGDTRFRELAGRPPEGLGRDSGWRFDIRYFREEVRRLHADPDRPAFSAPFEMAVERLLADVPVLTDQEILYQLMRISAILDDGHTGLYSSAGPPPHATVSLDRRTLPVMFNSFSDGLFVVAGQGPGRALVGAKVLRFGPLTTDGVLQRLAEHRGGDNPVTIRWLGGRFLMREAALLKAIGAAESADRVTLTIERQDGATERVALPSGDYDFPRKLRPQRAEGAPMYLRRVDTPYWTASMPEWDAIYFQFNQVRDADAGPSIAEFAPTLDMLLESTGSTRLIVDLRHNNGGNNGLLPPLLRVIGGFAVPAAHRVYVVTGQNTFSAAQNFLTRVEQLTGAEVVGEPSASSPNFLGEETTVVLPWSGVAGSISSLSWQDGGPNDTRQWIAPDIPVPTSSADYFGGRDPVLEALRDIFAAGL